MLNRRRTLIIGIATLIIIGSAVIIAMSTSGSNGPASVPATSRTAFEPFVKNACDILTSSAANTALRSESVQNDVASLDKTTESLKTTNCRYTTQNTNKSVSLTVYVAKNQAQADRNAALFAAETNIPGYGDKAYWSNSDAHLNVLAHGNRYVLTAGSQNVSERSQSEAEAFASLIYGNF